MTTTRWLIGAAPSSSDDTTFVCLPPAGAGASYYAPWLRARQERFVCRAAQYAGHETRLSEPASDSLEAMASDLLERLQHAELGPVVLIGHSMGGMVAYLVARAALADASLDVRALVVSACRAPHADPFREIRDIVEEQGSHAAFELFHRGHAQLAAEEELLTLLYPSIEADFKACGAFRWEPSAPLWVPIMALTGRHDPWILPEELREWQAHTTEGFTCETFDGDHSFIVDNPAVLDHLTALAVGR